MTAGRGMFVLRDDGELVEMLERQYDSESLLQALLARYPNLLAGDQIDPAAPRRWLLVSREMPVPAEESGAGRWSVDHLFLDQDAVPTIVEVKRSSDTRIRREVVGQMLDYAANAVVYWPIEKLRTTFETTCEKQGLDPVLELESFLEGQLDAEVFWQQAKTNLQAGHVRLVFLADEIPTELRRVVEFLNAQMDPAEVLAVEIKQYVGQGLTTLVPRVLGVTAGAQGKKSSGGGTGRQWDEASFFADLEKHGGSGAAVGRRLLDWAQANTSKIWWGAGNRAGSFVPTVTHNGRDHQLFAVWSSGTVEIYFFWYQRRAPFDTEAKRLELLQRLNAIDGINLPVTAIGKRPNIPLSVLSNASSMQAFIATFNWFIEEIKGS